MKMIKRHFGTLTGSCLALAALAFAPAARSQSNPQPVTSPAGVVASMDARSTFATATENQLRQRGIDAHVQLQGDRRDVLHVEWQGIHRSDIFNFVNSSAMQGAKRAGFSTILFTSGTQQWEYNLARESMIWSPAQL
jgi:hypothetical protein